MFSAPPPSLSRAAARKAAAQQVLSVCAGVDAVTAEAHAALGIDDDRLFALLETRDQMLQDLAEHLAVLQHTKPTADNPLLAATERAVDEADALIASVCEAVATSQRATMELASRVAQRVETLRDALAQAQRASHAGSAYGLAGQARLVDLRR
jgi:hypothetical protein